MAAHQPPLTGASPKPTQLLTSHFGWDRCAGYDGCCAWESKVGIFIALIQQCLIDV